MFLDTGKGAGVAAKMGAGSGPAAVGPAMGAVSFEDTFVSVGS